jgi:hypothetical protein
MNFYTNVIQWGNQLLVRGVNNGERYSTKVKYSPTLFAPVEKPTKYKTLTGQYVAPIPFQTIKDAKEWVSNYKDQPDIVFGNTQYPYTYIADNFRNAVNWDIDDILIVTVDIEVQCENGFPSAEKAEEEMLSITLKNHQNKKIVV